MKSRIIFLFVVVTLLSLVLTACGATASDSQLPQLTSTPVVQPQAGTHPPVILRVENREEVIDGFLWLYQDIYFIDPDGDAVAMTYVQTSSSLTYPVNFSDDPIEASSMEQKTEVLFTVTAGCWQKVELSFESRVRDEAGNLSEPVLFTMSCTTPPVVDTRSYLISGFTMALPIALLLGLGFWLQFRKRPGERLSALVSMLLFLCLVLFFKLVGLVLHEGGHSLYNLYRGVPITLYVHPFLLSGYSRPAIDNTIWQDIPGSLTSLPLALLISLPLWKRRSFALLPLVMLFPWVAVLQDGLNVLGIMGDFHNLVLKTGISPIPFYVTGAVLIIGGMMLLFALFPLLGLDPKDYRALFVLPAGFFLWNFVSFLVAYFFVPGSPIDRQYFLGQEIMAGGNSFLLWPSIGLILGVLYSTLYRRIHPRLPAWLRTETVALTWKDLRLPALLAVVSVTIGLIIII